MANRVVHLSRNNSVLIQDFGPVYHSSLLPLMTSPDGPSEPNVQRKASVPISRSMREAYYLPKDIEAMAGIIDFAQDEGTGYTRARNQPGMNRQGDF